MPSNRNFSLTNTVFLLGFGFFLSWTLGVQLITLTSSPFDFLYGVLAFSILAAILSARSHFVLGRADSLAIPRIKVTSIHLGAIAPHGWLLLAALGLVFSLSAGIQYKTSNYNYFWVGCLSVGALAIFLRGFFEKTLHIDWSAAKEEDGLSVDIVFVIAVIVGSAFYILTSIPDADDSLFLNFAVGAKEEREAVFVKDTMLGLNGLEFIKSTYRLESYQLLTAIISDASGWSVLFVAHTVVPLLTYLWAASILTIVHRLLFPQSFAATLLLHAAVLVAIDGSLLSFGYHAIPRFLHGKAPFLVAMIPLMVMLSLLWLKKKSRPALFLLVGSTIISVGFTANAIYVAPLCVALIGLTFLVFGKQDRLRAFSLIFVALYPAMAAGYLLFFDPPGASEFDSVISIGRTMWGVFGSPVVTVLGLIAIFSCVAAPLINARLCFLSFYMLAFLIFLANPVIWPFLGEYVTGNINYRLFWAIPIPLAFSILLGVIWSSSQMFVRAGLVLALGLATLGPGSIIHKSEFGIAWIKVPEADFSIAKRVTETVGSDALLLAPESISRWVTTLEDAPDVVEGRALYAPQRRSEFLRDDLASRRELFNYWSTTHPVDLEFPDILSRFDQIGISSVLVDVRNLRHANLVASFEDHGFSRIWQGGTDYQLFTRDWNN